MSDVPDTAVCLGCGYSLRGLPTAICPECGRGFDSEDRRTFRDVVGPYGWRGLATAPRAWHRRMVLLTTIVLLIDISSPGQLLGFTFFYLLPACSCICIVFVDYLGRLAAVVARKILRERDHVVNGKRKGGRGWLLTPVCIALLAAALYYPWPAWARFRLSLPAFERMVKAGSASDDWSIVGLFIVRRVSTQPNGVVFYTTGFGVFGEEGFAYGPTRRSLDGAVLVEHKVAPSWYVADQDW